MNLKFKKLYATLGVGLLSALSFTPTLNIEAALTAPTTYDYRFASNGTNYRIGTPSTLTNVVYFDRTADGVYYNYSTTILGGTLLPTGLDVTMTFNRSNTNWQLRAGFPTYSAQDTKIGSNNTVGGVNKKWYVKIDNQTNHDYKLFLDFSSTNDINRIYHVYLNGVVYINNLSNNRLYYVDSQILFDLWVPSFSYVEFYTEDFASNTNYFHAWYLQDLGVSAAYEQGVDDGYIQGQDDADLLVTGFSAMVGILVNFVLMIVNLEVFGVSLLGIFSIVVLFTGIVWTLKLIRG